MLKGKFPAGTVTPKGEWVPKAHLKHVNSHVSKTNVPSGNWLGTGMKNKVGKMRSDSVGYRPVSKKQLGTPPRNLA